MANYSASLSDSLMFSVATAATWAYFIWGFANWGYGNPGDLWYLQNVFYASNTVSVIDTAANLRLSDGSGFDFVFTAPSTNAVNRANNSYTSMTASTASWTCQAIASGVWT